MLLVQVFFDPPVPQPPVTPDANNPGGCNRRQQRCSDDRADHDAFGATKGMSGSLHQVKLQLPT